MKRTTWAVAFLLAFCWITSATAQMADAGSRESLVTSENLYPFSAGVDYLKISRDIEWEGGGKGELEGDGVTAFLGVDPMPWLTVFLTAGITETGLDSQESASGESIFSLGLDLNLWQYDLTDPEFMEGRLSLRGGFEGTFAGIDSGAAGEGDWTEWSGYLTANYEVYVKKIQNVDSVPYSLVLSAGPAFSILDGDVDVGGITRDFEGSDTVGFVYGVDLFLSHTLSLGFHMQNIDSANWRASARYRF
jgi:hypothetical protein